MTVTLESMQEQSLIYDRDKEDYVQDVQSGLMFWEDGLYIEANVLQEGDRVFPYDDWSLQQVCQKLGPPPFRYMKECNAFMRTANLEYWRVRQPENRRWLVRTWQGAVRAVLSSDYVPIGNTWVIESIMEMVQEGVQGGIPYEIVHPVLTPDQVDLRMLVMDTTHENYRVGYFIRNGEIGNYAVQVSALVQRHTCTNSMIFADTGFTQRHYKVSPAFLKGAIKEKVGQALQLAPEIMERIVTAEATKVPSFAEVIARVCETHGFSQELHDLILMGTESQETVMAVSNGLSFAAQRVRDERLRVDMETLAGEYVLQPQLLAYEGPTLRGFTQSEE